MGYFEKYPLSIVVIDRVFRTFIILEFIFENKVAKGKQTIQMSLDLRLWLRAQTVAEENGRNVLTWEAAEWTDAGRELLAPAVADPPHRKFGLFLISTSLFISRWATRMCRFLYQTLNEAFLIASNFEAQSNQLIACTFCRWIFSLHFMSYYAQ